MDLLAHPLVGEAVQKLDGMLDGIFQQRQIAGLTAALVVDRDIAWWRGYGFADLERGIPADLETVFDTGSIVKMLTDTLLMQARDAGLLNLDDPLEQYLPEFRLSGTGKPGYPAPTFRQVAGHIAGVPREPGYQMDPLRGPYLPAMAAILAKIPQMSFVYPPMTGMHYSNLGVYLLGHALGRVMGQPYRQSVQAQILAPLGMHSSGWDFNPQMEAHRAVKYIPLYGGRPRRQASPVGFGETGAPGGGFSASVADMARFVSFQFHDGSDERERILGRSSLQEMRLPVWAEPWGGIGIGWFLQHIAGHRTIRHGGSGPGCTAMIWMCPDFKIGLVLMMNEMNFLETPLGQQAMELLIPAFEAAARGNAQAPAARLPLPASAAACAGCYETSGDAWSLAVRLEDGDLKAVLGYAGQDLLGFDLIPDPNHPEDELAFSILGSSFDGEPVCFEPGLPGEMARLMLWGLPFDKVS
jgi:CubicO group peptidase (beta-lactamase class C family)